MTCTKATREASSMQTWTYSQVMPCPTEPMRSSFLIVKMDQFAWMVALIAPDRLCRLEGRELVEAEPPQNAADGRRRHADLGSDLLGRVAPSPQCLDRRACGRSCLARR